MEALITEIYEGGGYCLEYTPDGAEQNEVRCYDADMLEVSEEKYDPEQKILLYKSDCKNRDILISFCILFYILVLMNEETCRMYFKGSETKKN